MPVSWDNYITPKELAAREQVCYATVLQWIRKGYVETELATCGHYYVNLAKFDRNAIPKKGRPRVVRNPEGMEL